MARRPSKAAPKRSARVSYAALVADVEARKRPRIVPGRKVAVVPLADLREFRRLKREAEDREDREILAVAAARPEAYSDLDDVKARLLG